MANNPHMMTAHSTLRNVNFQIEEVSERLGRAYISLSRTMDETARTSVLGEINAAMADLRMLSERLNVVALSVAGIESDVQAGMQAMARIIYGATLSDPPANEEGPRDAY